MQKIAGVLAGFGSAAVIFDLDGTILDNNAYHLKSWKQYLRNIGREMSDEEFNEKLNGRTNRDVVKYLYGNGVSEEEIRMHTYNKEAIYREMYAPYIRPVPGLISLLQSLQAAGVPMAIATSGIEVNINFMFDHVPIRQYFKKVVDSSYISKGKPDPEIFLTTASFIGVPPQDCLVFEDAVVGVRAAKAAGMKVIAVSTTETREDLHMADMIITDYTELE